MLYLIKKSKYCLKNYKIQTEKLRIFKEKNINQTDKKMV